MYVAWNIESYCVGEINPESLLEKVNEKISFMCQKNNNFYIC